MVRRRGLVWGALVLLVVTAALPLKAAFGAPPTLVVDDDKAQCPNAGFTRIQDAVNAALPGATIQVCPGNYVEQITVPTGKDGLTLTSQKLLAASITAPPALLPLNKAIVRVAGAKNTTIRGFVITGPGTGACDSLEYGVRVDGGGSAAIQFNHITAIRDTPFSGCQNGVGIQVGRAAEGQTGSATITANLVDDYQKNGITVSNTGSSAVIAANIVRGTGPTPIIAQNGIQISSGATATVQNNSVTDNVYSPQTVSSTGILLFAPGAVQVLQNVLSKNDEGVYAFTATGPVISGNRATSSVFDGIVVDTTTGARVSGNQTDNNSEYGIGLFAATNNSLTDNRASANSVDGFFADPTSTNNSLTNNQASGSKEFDCRDDSKGAGTAGTANLWKGDTGASSSPPGICRPPQGETDRGGERGERPEHPRPHADND